MLSDFQHLLTSNDIPSESETHRAKSYCSDAQTRVESIRKRLEEMDAERRSLARELEGLQVRYSLDAHKAIISPLRRLPTELLQDIFLRSSPNHCVMKTKEPPLIYGRVCSRWRSISLSMPELWSNLHLVIPRPVPSPQLDTQTITNVALGINQWMTRAGDVPLDIQIVCRERRVEESAYALDMFMEFILTYGHRLKRLMLDIPSFLMDHFCGYESAGGFPWLETVHFSVSDYHYPLNSPTTTPMLRSAPSLHKATFACFCPDLRTEIPLSQLTHLSIEFPDNWCANTLEILVILEKCTALTACKIHTSEIVFPDQINAVSFPQPVVLPKLQNLDISAIAFRLADVVGMLNLPDFFDNVDMPSLVHLRVDGHRSMGVGVSSDLPFMSLHRFLQRSTPPLETLKLGSGLPRLTSEITITECLRCAPKLRKLVIRESSYPWNQAYSAAGFPKVETSLLKLLTVDRSDATFSACPALEELKLDDAFGFVEDELEAMLKSRAKPCLRGPVTVVIPLKKVKISTYRQFSDAICELPFVDINKDRIYDNARDVGRDWSDDWRLPWNFSMPPIG